MRNSVLVCGLLAAILAVVSIQAAPPTPTPSRSPNPQVNLLRQGLIEKLCRNQLNGGAKTSSTTTTTTSTTTVKPTIKSPGRGTSRRSRQAVDTSDPACSKYSNYTFAQLIEENKKLLRPVGSRRQ